MKNFSEVPKFSIQHGINISNGGILKNTKKVLNEGYRKDLKAYLFSLEEINKLKKIPMVIVQGIFDFVCPFITAYKLHQLLQYINNTNEIIKILKMALYTLTYGTFFYQATIKYIL